MSTVHYNRCPVCKSSSIHQLITVKDHSVSGEEFPVWQCNLCQLRFTQDVPDEASIGVYYQSQDYISHSNTSKGLVNRVYKKVRKHTLASKAALVRKYTKDRGALLDIGAGVGAFLDTMKQKGWTVTGIEPDEGARRQASSLFGLEVKNTDILKSLPAGSFDAITLWHVLEHVHELHPYMDRLRDLLKESGKIFIAVPNYTSADAAAYGSSWAAYDVPRHLYHFSPRSIEHLVKSHGLRLVAKKPMWFDSFYISLLSSKYRKGNTSWINAGWNGLKSNLKALTDRDRCSSLIYIVEKADG
jgi:2-polyprenyl-3-methyl-5-hydroxy-6-metoxy-1,4-benzoquinol methylase